MHLFCPPWARCLVANITVCLACPHRLVLGLGKTLLSPNTSRLGKILIPVRAVAKSALVHMGLSFILRVFYKGSSMLLGL